MCIENNSSLKNNTGVKDNSKVVTGQDGQTMANVYRVAGYVRREADSVLHNIEGRIVNSEW